ncbi:hypothetical protein QTL95_23940 [Rhizobium sp. S152]|uniref:hypothetical protein n=1 Tax=Rhizobium sp. S152 TaxID=3055038 RepID=UPI0025A99484|nr:hypothetical protein [Rhizobium sp. S152]MDM9628954.1 hypothetical protein [Rhizobium sp. S152]
MRKVMFIGVASGLSVALSLLSAGTVLAQGAAPQGGGAQPPAAVNATPGAENNAPQAQTAGQGCDAACVVANMDRAAPACARAIEIAAPIDFDWLNRPFTGIFQEADPAGGSSPLVVYRGDSIRFLTARGQWMRQTYECPFDVSAGAIGPVKVRSGRIGQPLPAEAAAAPRPAPPTAGNRKVEGKVDGKALAAAISQAVQAQNQQAKQGQGGARPPRPAAKQTLKIKPGEVSPVEVEQMDMGAQ